MKLIVNGVERTSDATTLAELCEEECGRQVVNPTRAVAIAVNGSVIRSEMWAVTQLRLGDRIEIVRPLAGG